LTEAERRRRVEEICDAALHHEERTRATFVDGVCGGDEALRREVEALLAQAAHVERFLSTPIGELAANVLYDDPASAAGRLQAVVADGSVIDWDLAESAATSTEERFAISQLREIVALGKAAHASQPTVSANGVMWAIIVSPA
jgi:hypothetical protein